MSDVALNERAPHVNTIQCEIKIKHGNQYFPTICLLVVVCFNKHFLDDAYCCHVRTELALLIHIGKREILSWRRLEQLYVHILERNYIK